MISYTSKDIVERAEQLADLQNSDFISDSEKSALLNENWLMLYQKIIDSNDRAFIKTVSAHNGMKLPPDFYQLAALYVERDREQINRINASQKKGYSITNNVLLISLDYDEVNVIMEYYPKPKTVFFSSGRKESKSFIETPKIVIDDDLFIGIDGNLYSFAGDSLISAITTNGISIKNGSVNTDESGTVIFTDFSGNTVETRIDTPFVVKGNEITYDNIKSDDDLSDYMLYLTDGAGEQGYFLGKDWKLYTKDFEEIITISESDLLYCRNDGLYIAKTGANRISRVLGKVIEYFPLSVYSFCAFVDGMDCILSFNGNYYKSSYGFSTVFDYSNNIYFTLLCYLLAISFKMKQQGDTAALQAKYEAVEKQFFDSLQRDVNQFYTMKDVYRNGRGRIWS